MATVKRMTIAALAVLVIDQGTKALVRRTLALGHRLGLKGGFALWHTTNSGVTLGIGRAYPQVWIAVAVVVAAAIVAIRPRLRLGAQADWIFGIILGGVLGNLVDRFVFGTVTDFLQIPLWPGIMNFADIAVRLGLAALVVVTLFPGREGSTSASRLESAEE